MLLFLHILKVILKLLIKITQPSKDLMQPALLACRSKQRALGRIFVDMIEDHRRVIDILALEVPKSHDDLLFSRLPSLRYVSSLSPKDMRILLLSM